MRERKFRAWLKNEKKIVVVDSINFISELIYFTEEKEIDGEIIDTLQTRFFNDIELIEYIGREDENGVSIYEGDIVERKYNCGTYIERAIVKYSEEGVGFYFDGFDYDLLINFGRNLKVIGNIYENPELLEVK